ncbi:hypothetical protein [Cupriavidus sp. DL-D2]|uniref:hypothetical protein n=1 Tax=Cupriavidus sp. DL-D2 TaxID=3144974 RepID=UPI003215AF44
MKAQAQKVIDNYRDNMAALDGDQLDALIELGDQAERIVKLVELSEQLAAAMDNVLLHHGPHMPMEDLTSRLKLVDAVQELLSE